ncbi:Phage integrase family protein [Shigella dysenteriae WRSd3]|uniref:Phage integrase family protein n=3 Tax=Shigella dysenteriae TaxID=622 RepID=A0A090NBK3_SHIDY|nr:Phage integrase family protein [Shigella dysenteriae 1617]EFX7691227.1 hypothetical protein [Shigella dysenteriae]ESU77102.1 Phage integrase family protein [Shigella dysenteriae WRSd3]EFX9055513.1 hypothetical protein [Shigella dysenteriae]EFX9817017.1 hypothetical protein [Shigella dysenteriae]
MSRTRKNAEDNKLPPRVYKNKYSYYFKPTPRECITLGKINDLSIAQVWVKYEEILNDAIDVMTFSKLWNKFLSSTYYLELSQRTQQDYLQHQKKLLANESRQHKTCSRAAVYGQTGSEKQNTGEP